MKKSFYFALALTAGLFASCSSDEIAQAPQGGLEIDENAPAKIELGVGRLGATVETRGTGSVGVDATGNTGFGWAGQKFNAFMLKQGTMQYARLDGTTTATVDLVLQEDDTDPTAVTGLGAEFDAPDQAGTGGAYGAAGLTTGLEVYYPASGQYDFWAYRLDDAVDATQAVSGADDANATEIKIPFAIDGTQDVMVAKVTPGYPAGMTDAQKTAAEAKLYSAYTGRRSIKAQLDFKHQLTRLTFKVKANSIEVSDKAAAVPGTPDYVGFKVTGISVYSNTTGKLVAASTDANWDPENALEWDPADWTIGGTAAEPTAPALTELQLKSRAYGTNTAEVGSFFAIDLSAITVGTTTIATAHHGNVTITDNMYAYDSQEKNTTTGVPSGTKKTIAQWVAADPTATVYYWEQDVAYVPDLTSVNYADNLQNLIPVQPKWEVTTNAVHAETTVYTIPAGVINVADNAALVADAATQADGTYTYLQADDNTYREVVVATAAVTSNTVKYTVTGAEVVAADDAAVDAAQDAAAATGVTVFFVGGTKYVSSEVTAEAVSSAVPTPVGEALLVAPADENGYFVTVYYNHWKKDNATTSHEEINTHVSKAIVLKNKTGVQTAQKYKAGKQYNITIELFKDGTAESSTTVTDWEDDDDNALDDSYEFE